MVGGIGTNRAKGRNRVLPIGRGDLDASVAAAVDGRPLITDGVGEWWCHPYATYQESPYPRIVFGAISKTGQILACEITAQGRTRRHVVGQATRDDHNVPALWVMKDHRSIIAWTNHSAQNYMCLKAGSANGDLSTLISAPEVRINLGSGVSYTQIHRITHLSDATQDTFYIFTRISDTGWSLVKVSVNQATGAVTNDAAIALWQGGQAYFSTADAWNASGNQVIRIGVGFNPDYSSHKLWVFELDVVTGAITTPTDSFTANLSGTNLPITPYVATAFVAESDVDWSRRFFYVRPGPDSLAVAYADWAVATPDAATYKVATWQPGYKRLVPGTGAASAASNAAMTDSNGFTYTVVVKTPSSAPAGNLELGRRNATNLGWSFLLSNAKGLIVQGQQSSGAINHTIAAPATIFNWGDTVGFRLVWDVAGGKIRRYWSPNPLDTSPTWTEYGSGAGLTITGTFTDASSANFNVPTGNTSLAGLQEVILAELKNSSGTVVAAVDWRTQWTAGATSFTDTPGRSWSIVSNAAVSTAPGAASVTSFGVAGPRIGYTANANYIAGLAFENPSRNGVVVRARSEGGQEIVDRIIGGNVEVLLAQPTGSGRLIRPYVPINGGPLPALVTEISEYSATTFTDYAGNVRSV